MADTINYQLLQSGLASIGQGSKHVDERLRLSIR